MKYLKVFVDFAKDIEGLSDTEAGRLFRAMLRYADTNEEPNLRGAEKILWPVARKAIDNQRDAYIHMCEVNKQNITNRYKPLQTATDGNESKQEKDKDKEKEKEKENITPKKSFFHSIAGRDDEDGLERTIKGLHLDLYEGTAAHFAKAIDSAIRTMWRAESIPVCGRRVPREEARASVKSLTIDHIDNLLAKMENMDQEDPIINGQAYLMACLYNAPFDFSVNIIRGGQR